MKTQRSTTKLQTVLKSSILMLAAPALVLSGCSKENSSDAAISSALACLDAAKDATTADTCVQKIQGIDTQQANLIRCSADFVAQGLTGTRLANAFQQQKGSTTAVSNQTLAMASYLVFNDTALPNHTSAITVTDCNKSGVPSVIGLASLVSVATTIATVSGQLGAGLNPADPSTFDPTAIKSALSQLITNASTNPNSPTVQAQETAIGQAALSAQTAYCGSGSSLSSQDVCKQLNASISGSTDAASIGYVLLQQLSH